MTTQDPHRFSVMIPVTHRKLDIPCPCSRTWFDVDVSSIETRRVGACPGCGRVLHVRRSATPDTFDGRSLDLVEALFDESGKVDDLFAEGSTVTTGAKVGSFGVPPVTSPPVALSDLGRLVERVAKLEAAIAAWGASPDVVLARFEGVERQSAKVEREARTTQGMVRGRLETVEKALAQQVAAIANLRENESKLTRSVASLASTAPKDDCAVKLKELERKLDAHVIEVKALRASVATLVIEHRKRVALRRKLGAPIERVNRWIEQARALVAEVLG